jgi:nucleotide-binding universal stress UspA family protein
VKLLVPIDGSEASNRAVRYVVDWRKAYEPLELHLLNVQPEPIAWELQRFLKPEEIESERREHGEAALSKAKALLESAGMPYHAHVLLGEPGEQIAGLTTRERFDAIVMGTRGMGSVAGLLMGSIARKVLQLATVPVTLVK